MRMLLLRFAFAMERHSRLGREAWRGGMRGKVVKRVVPNSKSLDRWSEMGVTCKGVRVGGLMLLISHSAG
jgi:hypothetical protein